jgi:hypothetical protein
VRQIIAEMLANPGIDPPADFVQFQIARLSEAMIARAMMEGNLQAVDRRITSMGELAAITASTRPKFSWRRTGRRRRASPGRSAARSRRIPPSAKPKGNFPPHKPLKFLEMRKESRTRRLLERLAAPERRPIPPNPARGKVEGKFSASQAFEIPRIAEGISDSALLERLAAPERRPIPPNPARGKVEGKFSASQAFEIPRIAEGISDSALLERLAAPDPAESGPRREPRHSVAGFAARDADGKRSRPEMAPQRLEKIESAPGNGMGSEASNLQDVVHGCAADHQRLRISGVSQKGGAAREL